MCHISTIVVVSASLPLATSVCVVEVGCQGAARTYVCNGVDHANKAPEKMQKAAQGDQMCKKQCGYARRGGRRANRCARSSAGAGAQGDQKTGVRVPNILLLLQHRNQIYPRRCHRHRGGRLSRQHRQHHRTQSNLLLPGDPHHRIQCIPLFHTHLLLRVRVRVLLGGWSGSGLAVHLL